MADITKNIKNLKIPYFGRGGCALVYKADFVKEGKFAQKLEVAVKVLFVEKEGIEAGGDGIKDGRLIRRRAREVEVWARARHPNILPFLGTCHISAISSGMHPEGDIGLVSPFCTGGNILDYLKKQPTVDHVYLLAQCAAAMQYLHTCDPPIIHGDIKGASIILFYIHHILFTQESKANILIDNNGAVRLSDFGISRILTAKGYTTNAELYSLRWSSVELLGVENEETAVSHLRTEASDVWAFGMTCLEVLTGKHPFLELSKNIAVLMALVGHTRPQRPSCPVISNDVWLLLEACWKIAAEERPSAASISLVWDLIHGFKGTTILSPNCVSALLNWMARSAIADGTQYPSHDQSRSPSVLGQQNPYMCKWPACWSSFATIDQCIEHECNDFMIWRVINLPPALRL